MKGEEFFVIDRAYLVAQAKEAVRIYFAPLVWLLRRRNRALLLAIIAAAIVLALTACAHQPLTRSCLTQKQYEQLKAAEPPRIHDKLTGKADEDTRPLAGSALELRSWGHAMLDTLKICSTP